MAWITCTSVKAPLMLKGFSFHVPTISTMVRHSKLQKQVLSLYRQFLRAGRNKPSFLPKIQEEFRINSAIQKTDVMHIEYLCRRAQRQLEQLRDVNTKQLGFFSKTKEDS
ncbi:succinate dehydrogenase assembly factor 1, mitochondrial isoform X2 [Neoarius graeffei]|uniref:succinate dehydrogenase assembly factor 1, mitochondrial isoform X2 n=1 Tax=Neoarius graeffei TaxID=443677 RepID=UPI00298D31EC|nr:succinate dehydrogenase assembly factor 1, mitochondrial isoform X2 [Neoarius graeffei]